MKGKSMDISKNSESILNVTRHLETVEIPPFNKLEIFSFQINANDFDYKNACNQLLDSTIDFALSRQFKEQYKDRPATLSKKARESFKDWKKNTGELGEFLLFCFLEGHLKAPKVLSKYELKTSANMHVHGSDGVHYLRLSKHKYQLIFGESKLYKNLIDGLREAFKSIHDFKNEVNDDGNPTSGIPFEKSLISENIDKESLNDDEKTFLKRLVYPTNETGDNAFDVDDAFGIFVGFEIADYSKQQKELKNDKFREYIDQSIRDAVNKRVEKISEYIDRNELYGHVFYIYVLPFKKIDDDRKKLLGDLVK